jgi:hypothetical protein
MRRAPLAAVLLALVAADGVRAAPPGGPRRLGAAQPVDHRSHPGAVSEWWTVRFIDPRSAGWLEITARREFDRSEVRLVGVDARRRSIDEVFGVERLAATRGKLTASGPAGAMAVRGGNVSLSAPAVTGRLRLREARRGPVAHGWRLGQVPRPPQFDFRPVTLSWSMPIATSRARGRLIRHDGARFSLAGWRASYEHAWGDFTLDDVSWNWWDEAIVHRRRGAQVVFGLNRTDTVTGPGARDAQWLGILARSDARGVHVCRPRVDRREWALLFPEIVRWAGRLSARCGGMRVRLHDRPAGVEEWIGHVEVRARADAGGARGALAVHVAHEGF